MIRDQGYFDEVACGDLDLIALDRNLSPDRRRRLSMSIAGVGAHRNRDWPVHQFLLAVAALQSLAKSQWYRDPFAKLVAIVLNARSSRSDYIGILATGFGHADERVDVPFVDGPLMIIKTRGIAATMDFGAFLLLGEGGLHLATARTTLDRFLSSPRTRASFEQARGELAALMDRYRRAHLDGFGHSARERMARAVLGSLDGPLTDGDVLTLFEVLVHKTAERPIFDTIAVDAAEFTAGRRARGARAAEAASLIVDDMWDLSDETHSDVYDAPEPARLLDALSSIPSSPKILKQVEIDAIRRLVRLAPLHRDLPLTALRAVQLSFRQLGLVNLARKGSLPNELAMIIENEFSIDHGGMLDSYRRIARSLSTMEAIALALRIGDPERFAGFVETIETEFASGSALVEARDKLTDQVALGERLLAGTRRDGFDMDRLDLARVFDACADAIALLASEVSAFIRACEAFAHSSNHSETGLGDPWLPYSLDDTERFRTLLFALYGSERSDA
jgi:hypothetical protein